MNQTINFWVDMITSFDITVDDVPGKIKSAVIEELIKIGFITDSDIETVKDAKTSDMSNECGLAIKKGFDLQLSDGVEHHFSLEVSDQLNIAKLNSMANDGVEELPYHADGEVCKFYSKEDMAAINTKMQEHINYHTAYYNSMKEYIKSLNDITKIQNIHYGDEIPKKYQSEVLKSLNAK